MRSFFSSMKRYFIPFSKKGETLSLSGIADRSTTLTFWYFFILSRFPSKSLTVRSSSLDDGSSLVEYCHQKMFHFPVL